MATSMSEFPKSNLLLAFTGFILQPPYIGLDFKVQGSSNKTESNYFKLL